MVVARLEETPESENTEHDSHVLAVARLEETPESENTEHDSHVLAVARLEETPESENTEHDSHEMDLQVDAQKVKESKITEQDSRPEENVDMEDVDFEELRRLARVSDELAAEKRKLACVLPPDDPNLLRAEAAADATAAAEKAFWIAQQSRWDKLAIAEEEAKAVVVDHQKASGIVVENQEAAVITGEVAGHGDIVTVELQEDAGAEEVELQIGHGYDNWDDDSDDEEDEMEEQEENVEVEDPERQELKRLARVFDELNAEARNVALISPPDDPNVARTQAAADDAWDAYWDTLESRYDDGDIFDGEATTSVIAEDWMAAGNAVDEEEAAGNVGDNEETGSVVDDEEEADIVEDNKRKREE